MIETPTKEVGSSTSTSDLTLEEINEMEMKSPFSPSRNLTNDEMDAINSIAHINYDLSPAELNAILLHKYLLSHEQHRWVSVRETILDFYKERKIPNTDRKIPVPNFNSYAQKFAIEKMRGDAQYQRRKMVEEMLILREMEKVTKKQRTAVRQMWVDWKAEEWRSARESFAHVFGDKYQEIIVPNVNVNLVVEKIILPICGKWCDVFGYQEGISEPDFVVKGKPYQDIKRKIIEERKPIEIFPKKNLELILIGDKSREATDCFRPCMCGNMIYAIPDEFEPSRN